MTRSSSAHSKVCTRYLCAPSDVGLFDCLLVLTSELDSAGRDVKHRRVKLLTLERGALRIPTLLQHVMDFLQHRKKGHSSHLLMKPFWDALKNICESKLTINADLVRTQNLLKYSDDLILSAACRYCINAYLLLDVRIKNKSFLTHINNYTESVQTLKPVWFTDSLSCVFMPYKPDLCTSFPVYLSLAKSVSLYKCFVTCKMYLFNIYVTFIYLLICVLLQVFVTPPLAAVS